MALIANPLIAPPFMPAEVTYASAIFQLPGQFGQSSPSVRSRRSHGSSNDEAPTPSPDGLIEEDLRAGGPHLCEPPCENILMLSRNHPYYDLFNSLHSRQLISQLIDICENEKLRCLEMSFRGRRSEIDHDTSDPIPTLLVLASRDSVIERGWDKVARKLLSHLRNNGHDGVSVEIIDPRFEEAPSIHPCHPSDAIFPIWKEVVEDIIAQVATAGVYSISCFRIGRDTDRLRCPPTVLLGIDRQAHRDWRSMREIVVRILDARGLSTVAVLIRKDTEVLRTGGLTHTPASASDCRADPNLGASLSLHTNPKSLGTLGGWIELKNPNSGQWVPFVLTCCHCCFPRDGGLSSADLQVLREWKQKGVRFRDPNATRLLTVDAPCYRDIKDGIDDLATRIAGYENDDDYCRVKEAKEKSKFIMPSDERAWELASQVLSMLSKDRNTMKEFFHKETYILGEVFAASGLREVPSTQDPTKLSIRDWALVMPKGNRLVGKNRIPMKGTPHVTTELIRFATRIPKMDEEVYKLGRVTGFTAGKYANLKTCRIATQNIDNKEVTRETWEHTVLSTDGSVFLKEGDSGSLLFSSTNQVLGVLFGGTRSHDIAYFTSTDDLLEDIKRITGVADIRLRGDV